MVAHIQKELEGLKRRVLSLGTMAEERVHMAIEAVENLDGALAERIIKGDKEIDELEVELEEECLKIVALHQPVAIDLRFISAVIKINNDLERVGDEAVNIAQRVGNISRKPPGPTAIDYGPMTEKTESMLKSSLDALVNLDTDLAYKVCLTDDEVDEMNRRNYDNFKEAIKQHPEQSGYLINLLLISRHLERIADHATNIAEEVLYMIEGEITRHKVKE